MLELVFSLLSVPPSTRRRCEDAIHLDHGQEMLALLLDDDLERTMLGLTVTAHVRTLGIVLVIVCSHGRWCPRCVASDRLQ
jgi:hypothetical protein